MTANTFKKSLSYYIFGNSDVYKKPFFPIMVLLVNSVLQKCFFFCGSLFSLEKCLIKIYNFSDAKLAWVTKGNIFTIGNLYFTYMYEKLWKTKKWIYFDYVIKTQ